MDKDIPEALKSALYPLGKTDLSDKVPVKGYDFNQGIDFGAILDSYASTGFQALHFAEAVDAINGMLNWRLSDEPITPDDKIQDPEERKNIKALRMFGYTSNMVSCGMREVIRFLVQHKLVDCIVTTGGGIEEDFMKCWTPHYCDTWEYNGREKRMGQVCVIGNLNLNNQNYEAFESFFNDLVDEMHEEQKTTGKIFSPSSIIDKMGEKVNNEESIYYWCHKNNIPVFCPGITDGAIGDCLFVKSFNEPGFIVDLTQDIVAINTMAMDATRTGQVILGGGLPKHHIQNANLMRNGADWSVFINTGVGYDGSDSGASPNEAYSWGKIRLTSTGVKIAAEATLVFPLLVGKTFAKYHYEQLEKETNS